MADQLTAPLGEFKPREIEILGLMADGLSNQEIGDTLFITKETVRWYIKIIYSKLGTSRRTEAVALARRFRLIGGSVEENDAPKSFDLPLTTGPFVGRGDEIESLKSLLSRPEVRLITIVGAGGMGKSRLSLEFGHQIKSLYKHGAAFIDLTPVQQPHEIATAALNSLGQVAHDPTTPAAQLIDYCREKELLLIFDNFEHLLPGASLLADLLEAAPLVTLINTTRQRLNLRAETVYYLDPIQQDGGQLFRELAEMMHPHIDIMPADQSAIEQIVDLVGGLPLAIVLAATWLDTLSPAEIAAEIATNLEFLSAEMGDMPERQRSIHALLDPTWEKLSRKEQTAFVVASVFRGGFTRDLFQKVTGASVRTLQRLLHSSLITQGHGRRYDLHPLIRQYALEKLDRLQMEKDAQKAHLEAVTAYAEQQVDQMNHSHYLESLRLLNSEQDNFRAALDWSLAGPEVDTGIKLAKTLSNFWVIRSQLQEAAHYFEKALVQRPNLASSHLEIAYAYFRLGKPELAVQHNQKALELAEAEMAFDILSTSKRFSTFMGGPKKSAREVQTILEDALNDAQLSKNPRVIANCHVELGMLAFEFNSPMQESLAHFQDALTYYESRGRLRGISLVIYNMAIVYRLMGDYPQARALCERSLNLKREIGDRAGEARRLTALAAWDIDEEEFEQAAAALQEARIICEELGERRRLRSTIFQQGLLAMISGDYRRSEAHLQESLKMAESLNENEASQHAYLGLLFLLTGRVERSKPHIYQSIRIGEASGYDSWPSTIAYGNLLWAQGNVSDCTSIVVALQRELAQGKMREPIGTKYFLEPLIYRVQQSLGEEGWQQALEQAAERPVGGLIREILEADEDFA